MQIDDFRAVDFALVTRIWKRSFCTFSSVELPSKPRFQQKLDSPVLTRLASSARCGDRTGKLRASHEPLLHSGRTLPNGLMQQRTAPCDITQRWSSLGHLKASRRPSLSDHQKIDPPSD